MVVAALVACGRFGNGDAPQNDTTDGGALGNPTAGPEGSVTGGPPDSGAIIHCPGLFCEDFETTLANWLQPAPIEGVTAKIEDSNGGHAFFFDVQTTLGFDGQQLRATRPRIPDAQHVRVDFSFYLTSSFRPASIMGFRLFDAKGGELARPAFAVDSDQILVRNAQSSPPSSSPSFPNKTDRWIAGSLQLDFGNGQGMATIQADGHVATLPLPNLKVDLITSIELDCGLDSVFAGPTTFRVGYDNIVLTMEP